MDWALFIVFLLSITSLKCEILTVADDINPEETTPTSNIINTTDNRQQTIHQYNKEPELATITEENTNTTSEVTQSSGDIDVYYGFQALPVLVKFLGEDGKFHWYFAREGIEEFKRNFPHYGYNNQYWGQQIQSPYNYGGSKICSNPLQNCNQNSQGASILSQIPRPLNRSNHYHFTQNGFDTPPFDTYSPYVPYPWIASKPSSNWFNSFPYNHPGFSSPFPSFLSSYTGSTPYSEFNSFSPYVLPQMNPLPNPYLSNPYTGFNPYFSNILSRMSSDHSYSNPTMNYLKYSNPFSNYLEFFNKFQQNPYNILSQFDPFSSSYQTKYPYYQFFNELQSNPYAFLTQLPPFLRDYGFNKPNYLDFNPFLNNFQGFDGGYPFSHALLNTHNPYYRNSMVRDSPYNHASPSYGPLNYLEPSYIDPPYTRSENPFHMISSNLDEFQNYMLYPVYKDALNRDHFYRSDPMNPSNLNSPDDLNQFYRKLPFSQPTYLRSPNPYMSYNPTFFCKYPSNRPFLTTSYDYINRLPVDPIYRLFFKVLITSLANLYHRNGYIDEPVYSYPYYYSI